jgi:predicted metal-binding protein
MTSWSMRTDNSKRENKMSRPPVISYFARLARELGADRAKVIRASSVVTAEWVRWKCQFGCPGYGKRLTCPPYSPTPEQTKCLLADYRQAVLMCADGDRHEQITSIAVRLEREAFLSGYYKAFGMGAGPCRLCERCLVGRAAATLTRPAPRWKHAASMSTRQLVTTAGNWRWSLAKRMYPATTDWSL